jgi:dephospho-CoA kinase
MTYVIGLTGNIGTGKSTVLNIVRELGAHTIDADAVTRLVMQQDGAAYDAIVEEFGSEIVGPDGEIDRPALGRRVFSDSTALRRLEELVHPATTAWIKADIAETDADVVVIEAIKLIEAGTVYQLCDALWVVDVPPAVQLARLMDARGMSREDALQRMAAQPPQGEKVAIADVVIDNAGTIEQTRQQVVAAWKAIPKNRHRMKKRGRVTQ